MKKKILSISLVVIIAVLSIAGASLAYFTDTDRAENVFTFGNVEIELNEKFDDNELVPGKKLTKEVTVTNTGKNDAWVWVTVAIPEELDGDEQKTVLHTVIPTENVFGKQNVQDLDPEQTKTVSEDQCWKTNVYVEKGVDINGKNYNVYTHLYNGVLSHEETTTVCLREVYLDPHIDISSEGDLYWKENGVKTNIEWNLSSDGNPSIIVNAYAIQQEGFVSVEDAYSAYNA